MVACIRTSWTRQPPPPSHDQARAASAKSASGAGRELNRVFAEGVRIVGLAQLGQRVPLDLPDPLAGEADQLADLGEGVLAPIDEPEPVGQHERLAVVETVEGVRDLVPQ